MASGSILTQDFWANSAIFQTCIMAYNLMVWMMWLNDEAGFREEPNTIRMWLISVPAKLVTRSRRWQLKLSKNYPFKKRWTYLEESIQSLSFAKGRTSRNLKVTTFKIGGEVCSAAASYGKKAAAKGMTRPGSGVLPPHWGMNGGSGLAGFSAGLRPSGPEFPIAAFRL